MPPRPEALSGGKRPSYTPAVGLIRDAWRGKHMKDPVDGTAQVVACSATSGTPSTSQNCRMTLVIQAPSMPAATVEHEELVKMPHWPWPGQQLPVTVDRADPTRLKVRWDEVPPSHDLPTGATPTGADAAAAEEATAGVIAALQQAFPGAQIQVEGTTVQQGQPVQIVQPGVPGQPATAPVDRVGLLERLAKLHQEGLITDAEFQTEKTRILSEP